MGVRHINSLKDPKILFGINLPKVIYKLYEVAISERAFELALKNSLGIDDKRLVKLVEVVYGENRSGLLLVIYDKISNEKTFFKDSLQLKVNAFDFDIYNYDFNMDINIEAQINLIGSGS